MGTMFRNAEPAATACSVIVLTSCPSANCTVECDTVQTDSSELVMSTSIGLPGLASAVIVTSMSPPTPTVLNALGDVTVSCLGSVVYKRGHTKTDNGGDDEKRERGIVCVCRQTKKQIVVFAQL